MDIVDRLWFTFSRSKRQIELLPSVTIYPAEAWCDYVIVIGWLWWALDIEYIKPYDFLNTWDYEFKIDEVDDEG